MSPRPTKAILNLAKRTAEIFAVALFDDEEIRTAFNPCAYMMLKRLRISHPIRSMVEEALGPNGVLCVKRTRTPVSEEELQLQLLDVIKAKQPDWYHVIGTHIPFFQHLMLCELRRTAPDETTKQALSSVLEEIRVPTLELDHFPDNPITVERDSVTGKHTLTDVEEAELKDYMQIMAYFDSLRPARSAGRPRGVEKPKKSGRQPLPPEVALRVYQAKLDAPKWNWQQAARKVLGVPIPSDLKARERLRQRVGRLLALGARLHRKKSVR
jgi:hypothetical protein